MSAIVAQGQNHGGTNGRVLRLLEASVLTLSNTNFTLGQSHTLSVLGFEEDVTAAQWSTK